MSKATSGTAQGLEQLEHAAYLARRHRRLTWARRCAEEPSLALEGLSPWDGERPGLSLSASIEALHIPQSDDIARLCGWALEAPALSAEAPRPELLWDRHHQAQASPLEAPGHARRA